MKTRLLDLQIIDRPSHGNVIAELTVKPIDENSIIDTMKLKKPMTVVDYDKVYMQLHTNPVRCIIELSGGVINSVEEEAAEVENEICTTLKL